MERIKDILTDLGGLVCDDRAEQHGDIYKQFAVTAQYWSIYLGVEVKPYQVARLMQLSKISREQHGQYNPDDFRDNNGYGVISQALREAQEMERQYDDYREQYDVKITFTGESAENLDISPVMPLYFFTCKECKCVFNWAGPTAPTCGCGSKYVQRLDKPE